MEIPVRIVVGGCNYSLGGLTFWNGGHYIARLLYNEIWYDYDGMQQNPLRAVHKLSNLVPAGFILTTCIYFRDSN